MKFLQAEWRKLVLFNYTVDPELLLPYVPKGTEIDLWKGKCYLSLVGFMFMNSRLLGIKFPFHVNFEEINLRFYVKREEAGELRRGVVFIRELVPRFMLAFIANNVYKEHYRAIPMRHDWVETDDELRVAYGWKKGGQWHDIGVLADPEKKSIVPGSEAEFLTEHYWGYTRVSETRTLEYAIEHPHWVYYDVRDHGMAMDFGITYGRRFQFLDGREPDSVILAEGSEVAIFSKRTIVLKQGHKKTPMRKHRG